MRGRDSAQAVKRGPATALFVDLCGYTALAETTDPEDLRDVMEQVFEGVSRIADKYEGTVGRLLGDGALLIFGSPFVHEDDAVRAIRAAQEIDEFVQQSSPGLEATTKHPLHMHSALATGVVVTSAYGDASNEGALGDAVNLASRLLALSGPGEIVCSEETRAETQGYFEFESLGPQVLKGRTGVVAAYRVGAAREAPATAHRTWGVRSRLVGRRDEWARLEEAVSRLRNGETTVLSVRGGAGTGKSRLVEEFRDSHGDGIRWIAGNSQPYAQNIPYHLFTEAIGRLWGILESDDPDVVREKITARVARIPGPPSETGSYVGTLFGLDDEQTRSIDSETWKRQIFQFFKYLISDVASRTPTAVYLGDLHWADPSSLELLRYLITTLEVPILVIATYRPPTSLFIGPPPAGLHYEQIRLHNLSQSEAGDMLASLLDTDGVASDLREFLQHKAEGNPFYLEELVNSLIDSGTLTSDGQEWIVARPLPESDIPLTVMGVVAARLDRLQPSTRRVLQEASVIGRTFIADLLGSITSEPSYASGLDELQKLDLVRVHTFEPRLEYEFKHALIQDVAYAGLLRQDRVELHERVGSSLESLFSDRLPEAYETLALHFSRGISTEKAVHYLQKSAEKSFERYAVEESDEFYRQAFELLAATPQSAERDTGLVRILNGWGYVIYDRGEMAELVALLESHQDLAESLGVARDHAMFCVTLAIAMHCSERFEEAVALASRGLEMAEELGDEHVAACARVWLAYGLSELGRAQEALELAERAIPVLRHDPIWITEAYSALAFATWTLGDAAETLRIGQVLLELGQAGPNTRALAAGYWVLGEGWLSDGDFAAAEKCFVDSIEVSPEPWPSQHPRIYLAISLIQLGRYDEAEPYLREVLALSEQKGAGLTLTPAKACSAWSPSQRARCPWGCACSTRWGACGGNNAPSSGWRPSKRSSARCTSISLRPSRRSVCAWWRGTSGSSLATCRTPQLQPRRTSRRRRGCASRQAPSARKARPIWGWPSSTRPRTSETGRGSARRRRSDASRRRGSVPTSRTRTVSWSRSDEGLAGSPSQQGPPVPARDFVAVAGRPDRLRRILLGQARRRE